MFLKNEFYIYLLTLFNFSNLFLGAEGATAIDEGLFEDEDLDELEDDLQNLEVWFILRSTTIWNPEI